MVGWELGDRFDLSPDNDVRWTTKWNLWTTEALDGDEMHNVLGFVRHLHRFRSRDHEWERTFLF